MLTRIQAAGIVLTLVIAFLRPQLASKYFRAASRGFSRIARQRGLSVALVGLLSLGVNVSVSFFVRMPQPSIHDEFSYLLAADTFARGRLANPSHPMWVHFESFHIIQNPTYASKYPPAQGLIMAAGQFFGGGPIAGVWLSIALACAATCWMLQAWLPLRWALLGALLVALHPRILWWWGQSYWGGAVAMFAGALVFGALRRIIHRPRLRNALLMGLGLAVLANSRPYEGLVASFPALAVLFAWMVGKSGPPVRVSLLRVVLPILIVLAPAIVAMGLYNLRVTGAASQMPYQLYETTYGSRPLFLWQYPKAEPTYRHEVMRTFYKDWELTRYMRQRALPQFIEVSVQKVKRLWWFYLGYLLTVSLVMLPWVLKKRWMWFALLTCGLSIAASLQFPWTFPHYTAPITGLVFLLVLEGMRRLRLWQWQGKPTGRFMVRAITVIFIASLLPFLAQKMRVKSNVWHQERAQLLAQLKQDGERHLVIVRYGPKHSWHNEWVYNEADIDSARVVWAREMDVTQNRRLLEYFKDRQPWLLEANGGDSPSKLVPYPSIWGRDTANFLSEKAASDG
jgi:hypothetical protein